MTGLTIKNKITVFAVSLVFLILSISISAIWGLSKIHYIRKRAISSIKIKNNFDRLTLLFEKSLMSPHDYLIHGDYNEKKKFKNDFTKVILSKDNLKKLIKNSILNHRCCFIPTFSKNQNEIFKRAVENDVVAK